MVKRLFLVSLLSVAFATVTGSNAFAGKQNDGAMKGFPFKNLFKHKPDSSRYTFHDFQDTSKKKIKEIAPAKRQPKPERINEPPDGGRPGVISRPPVPGMGNGFPDGRGIQPGNSRPPQDSRPPQGGGSPGSSPHGGGRRGG